MDWADLERIPIENVVSTTGTNLKRISSNFIGFCPLHQDKNTPSFVVYPRTNSWCCFGSCEGKKGHYNGGGVLEFVKQRFNYTVSQARTWLEENFELLPSIVFPTKEEPKPPPPKNGYPVDNLLYWNSLLEETGRISYFRERGFNGIVESELWGWDGKRYTIPVWEGEPLNSPCINVRCRASDISKGSKYIGIKDYNEPTIWGRWHCKDATTLYAFAGELDAARAVQDGLPAFSLVNGKGIASYLPSDWPQKEFPQAQHLIVIFDKKEELDACKLASTWNKVKGPMMGKIFQWPPDFEGSDYCEFRDENPFDDFLNLVKLQ